MSEHAGLPDDLLRGAAEIALYVFGDRKLRRRLYHLISHSRMPHFCIGSMICARKSVLHDWISRQEQTHANDNRKPAAGLNSEQSVTVGQRAIPELAKKAQDIRRDIDQLRKELDTYLIEIDGLPVKPVRG